MTNGKNDRDRLYGLLPAVYRERDAAEGNPLQALLRLVADQADILQVDIQQLWDNFFIETCERWAIPYIGDLVGNNLLHDASRIDTPDTAHALFPDLAGRDLRPDIAIRIRADVAKTIYYRRRKGTLPMLEELARDVTGWAAHAVEFFELLGWTQHLNHLRLFNLDCPDLRRVEPLDRLNGPFDTISHTVDVRPIHQTEGWYNIRNIGFFLWRLRSYPAEHVAARQASEAWQYHFSPLGHPAPLFSRWRREGDEAGLATEIHVPGPIRPAAFYEDLQRYQAHPLPWPDHTDFYGLFEPFPGSAMVPCPDCSFVIIRDGTPVPPNRIRCQDLTTWVQPTGEVVGVDVRRGRMAFGTTFAPTQNVDVYYHYGFSADLGGGPYERGKWLVRPDLATLCLRVQKGGVPPEAFPTLSEALGFWGAQGKPNTIITILDNRTYVEPMAIELADGAWLVIEAANGKRSHLQPDGRELQVVGNHPGSELTLSGLLIEGAIHVSGDLGRLRLLHTTLVRGLSLDENGDPATSDPSLIVEGDSGGDEINATLRVQFAFSIAGPIRLPEHADGLWLLDSIVDGIGGTAISATGTTDQSGPPTSMERVTIFGQSYVKQLPLASEVIFTEPVVSAQRQEGCVRFSFVPHGSQTPRRYRCQPDLEIATQIAHAEKQAQTNKAFIMTGVMSAALSPFPTLTNSALELMVTIDSRSPRTVRLGGQPPTLEEAAVQLQTGLRAADAAPAFARARVLAVDDRLLVLPGEAGVQITFAPTSLDDTTAMELGLDPTSAQVMTVLASRVLTPVLMLTNPAPEIAVTVGSVGPRTVSQGNPPFTLVNAANQLEAGLHAADAAPAFAGARVLVMNNRLLIVPGTAETRVAFFPTPIDNTTVWELGLDPHHTTLTQVQRHVIRTRVYSWLKPSFTAIHYGQAGYAQLRPGSPEHIRTGAEDGSEMGVFSHLKQSQRETNLRIRLDEYLPFGLDAGLIYVT